MASSTKKLLPPPSVTPEFPKKWPEKPILIKQYCHPFFIGRFLLEVHPQKFDMTNKRKCPFGIKNPTKQHIQYCLELGKKDKQDLKILTMKGAVANNGVVKPGEIVRLELNLEENSEGDYSFREVIISYCILDSQKKIDAALKHDPSKRSLTYETKGSYHQSFRVKEMPVTPDVEVKAENYQDEYQPDGYHQDRYYPDNYPD